MLKKIKMYLLARKIKKEQETFQEIQNAVDFLGGLVQKSENGENVDWDLVMQDDQMKSVIKLASELK